MGGLFSNFYVGFYSIFHVWLLYEHTLVGQYDLIWTLCWSWMHLTVKAGSETNLLPIVITRHEWTFVITPGVLSKWLFWTQKNQSSDEATWDMRHLLLVVFNVIVNEIASIRILVCAGS